MNYRFNGQQRTLSFGRWPEILLGDAREMLLEARRQLAKGLDPFAQAKLLVLKKLEASKRYYTANRIRSTCSQVFRYAIATARAERDICTDLRGALVTARTNHRAAITTPTEAGGLLRAIEDYDGNGLTRIGLRLLPHVFVRPGELRWAEWSEFDFDKAVWTIAEYTMKMRHPHALPSLRGTTGGKRKHAHCAVAIGIGRGPGC